MSCSSHQDAVPPEASTSPEIASPEIPSPETGTSSHPSCDAKSEWLHQTFLPPDVPADTICGFDQYAWQAMLFLVQPSENAPSVLNFESYMPNYGLFVGPDEEPVPYGQHPPDPCNPDESLVDQATGARMATGRAPFVYSNIVKQAGLEQPLIAPDGEFAWYGISVNEDAYDMVTGCDLYRSDCAGPLKPDNPGTVDIIDKYPDLAFPDGAAELKTSWKVLSQDEIDSGLFYSVNGWIQPRQESPDCRMVTLGLVGIHIVVKTPLAPALIWATFEHRNNVPDCSDLSAEPPLGGSWNFYDLATCDNCTTNVYQPGHPGQICRMHPWGDSLIGTFPEGQDCTADPDQFACQEETRKMLAENTQAIRDLNDSARKLIGSSPGSIDPIWANYELVGNVWTRDQITPPQLQAKVGSLSAANTTMESYVQNGPSTRSLPYNCFSCHNQDSGTFGKTLPPVGLSHLFDEVAPKSGGCAEGSLPATCGPYTSATTAQQGSQP